MIFLGCFASVKFSALAIFVIATCLVYLLLQKRRADIIRFIPNLIMVPVVILLSYSRYFLLGHSLSDFLKVEKYIVVFYATGAKARVFAMAIPMLLINKWYTWWDGVLRIPEWTVLWPVSLISACFTAFILRPKSPFYLCLIWSFAYLVFLSLTPVYPRYLLLLLPFLYNLLIWALSQNTKSEILFSLGIVALFLLLRLPTLTQLPIFTDEAIYLRWAQIALQDAGWRFISLTDGKQPLFIWAVIVSMKFLKIRLWPGELSQVVPDC